jgi:hypothetical protein
MHNIVSKALKRALELFLTSGQRLGSLKEK